MSALTKWIIATLSVAVVSATAWSSLYVVAVHEYAIVIQFGREIGTYCQLAHHFGLKYQRGYGVLQPQPR